MAPRWPPIFYAYQTLGRLGHGILRRRLATKHQAEGGPPERFGERFGNASQPRPDGPLIWIHAVSVGEAMSVLALAEALVRDAAVLLTTTSVTSAKVLADRLPAGVIHQFAPIDTPGSVNRFLDHWRPDLMVLTESEVWPVTLDRLSRRSIPVALINARLSEKSANRWARVAPRLIAAAFGRMSLVLAQDEVSKARLDLLGAQNVEVAGSLKSAAAALPVDADAFADAQNWTAGRKTWVAASTHDGEEHVLLDAHARIVADLPGALLILAIRHPDRADAVAAALSNAGLSFARRSEGATPGAHDSVYLADTIGEMGLWYRLCPVVFMAGSLRDGIGGHNPVEAAQLGCHILSGPFVANAEALFAPLVADGQAEFVEPEASAIAGRLIDLLNGAVTHRPEADASSGTGQVDDLALRLLGLFPAP